jgi:hypothetical protein
VSLLPASPRARRRLRWIAIVLALLAAGLAVAIVIPGHDAGVGAPAGTEGEAQVASTIAPTRLSASDRKAIDAVLDAFIPAGMERRDPARAWGLAGPELKASATLADWRRGNSPVPAYQPRERTFHDWRTIDIGPRYVIFNLLLHPKHPDRVGTYVFSGEVVKSRGRWLLNRLYPIAIMNGPTLTGTRELGPADFAAPGAHGQGAPPAAKHGVGLVPVAILLGLILLAPLAVAVGATVRARRWRRRVRAADRTALPPLPSGYLRRDEERGEPVQRH